MPRVGSSSMSSRGAVLSHLPSTHFCLLPPLKVATSCSLERATMLSCWIGPAAWRSSLGVDRKPRVETERRESALAPLTRRAFVAEVSRNSVRRVYGTASLSHHCRNHATFLDVTKAPSLIA